MLREREPIPFGNAGNEAMKTPVIQSGNGLVRRPFPAAPVERPISVDSAPRSTQSLVPRESPLDRLDPQIKEHLLQRFNEAQLSLLLQKTPRREVRARLLNPNRPEGPGNPRLKYVEHAYVTETMNFLFGFNWDLEVLDQNRIENEAIVKARLRVRLPDGTVIFKDGFGGAFFQTNNPSASWADTFKSAQSDALKAAAARLGIGLDLYRHEEVAQEPGNRLSAAKPVIVENGDWNWFWARVKQIGLSREEVHTKLNVNSVKEWTAGGKSLAEAIQALEGR